MISCEPKYYTYEINFNHNSWSDSKWMFVVIHSAENKLKSALAPIEANLTLDQLSLAVDQVQQS